jgi:hypothetical protein
MATSEAAQKADDFYIELLSKGATSPVLLSSPYDKGMRQIIQAITNGVLDFARPPLKDEDIGELLRPERVVITTIPQATVQALTTWMDPVHAIAVNQGLMLFMYRVARALSPHVITRTGSDPPAPPESEAVSHIASLIDWISSPARAPLMQDWPTGQREIRTAENLTTAGERFVVSHEIGHIMQRHLIVDVGQVDTSQLSLQELDTRPYEQEIEADTIGAMLTIESMPKQKIDPRAGAVGIVMFLHSLRLAEEVGAIVADGNHPSASDRLATLQGALPDRYGSDFTTLTSWADQLSDLMNRLGDEALRERNRRRKKAAAHMDRVFREHPVALGPGRDFDADKAMLDEVLALLATAPSAVLEAVADNLLDAEEYKAAVSASASPTELLWNDRWRRHTIAHFIARYMPPNVRATLGVEWINFTNSNPET